MFSLLRAPSGFRLGLELGSQGLLAVMLDQQGVVAQRREAVGPTESDGLTEMLNDLLGHFPIKRCQVVMSLAQGYNIKVADLESREPDAIRFEAERWLPYQTQEASFAWHALGPRSTFVMAYPRELLKRLAGMLRPMRARSLAWEIREMVHVRTLHKAGLPAGLVELSSDWLRMAIASEGGFYTVSHYLPTDTEVNLSRHVERLLDFHRVRWKSLPQPQSLWVNAAARKSLDRVGLELLPLAEDFVAIGLANSPAGPHQFRV